MIVRTLRRGHRIALIHKHGVYNFPVRIDNIVVAGSGCHFTGIQSHKPFKNLQILRFSPLIIFCTFGSFLYLRWNFSSRLECPRKRARSPLGKMIPAVKFSLKARPPPNPFTPRFCARSCRVSPNFQYCVRMRLFRNCPRRGRFWDRA